MRWPIILNVARAELRAGVRGFWLFVACLAIGAAAIAGAGSTAAAFRAGLAAQSRSILGGDIAFERTQMRPSPAMLAWLEARGRVSHLVQARAMAAGPDARRLMDIRAIDALYPLAGKVELESGADLHAALAPRDGVPAAVVEKAALSAIGAKIGDRISVATGAVVITDVIAREPDAIGRGLALAPRFIVRTDALKSLGLAQEDSLFDVQTRVALRPGLDAKPVAAAFEAAFPELKNIVRTRERAADGLAETLDRLEAFIGFVGLAALLAGGLGVQGAVQAYVESRRGQIAVLRALGASGAEVRAIVALNVSALAALGIALGVAIGASAPFIMVAIAGDALPLPAIAGLDARALGVAATLSAIAAFAFAAGPIGSARITPPAVLFRGAEDNAATPLPERMAGWLGLLALGGCAALFSPAPLFAGGLALGAFAAFLALRGLGLLAQRAARGASGGARGVWRLAITGLGGRGSLAPAATPAIGLGIALLVFLTQLQANLVTQVTETAPRQFATGAFLEVQHGDTDAFDNLAAAAIGQPLAPAWYQRAPVLTARLTAHNGAMLIPEKIPIEQRWVVEGDAQISFLDGQPDNFTVKQGAWWPRDYQGPPLVSLEEDFARGLNVKPGDTLTFAALGQDIEARVANLRTVDRERMGPNFMFVFSPGVFEAANPRSIVLVRLEEAPQTRLETDIASMFPGVVILRIRDALEAVAEIFQSLTLAIRAVAAVAVVAGALAVAGAIAAGARRRLYEAAILKTLGFTRAQIVAAFSIEMALAGALAALIGAALGLAAAAPIIVFVLKASWATASAQVVSVVGVAIFILALAGIVAGFSALRTPPSRVLRENR